MIFLNFKYVSFCNHAIFIKIHNKNEFFIVNNIFDLISNDVGITVKQPQKVCLEMFNRANVYKILKS